MEIIIRGKAKEIASFAAPLPEHKNVLYAGTETIQSLEKVSDYLADFSPQTRPQENHTFVLPSVMIPGIDLKCALKHLQVAIRMLENPNTCQSEHAVGLTSLNLAHGILEPYLPDDGTAGKEVIP